MNLMPSALAVFILLAVVDARSQSFPPGFNCDKLTNDEARAACQRQLGLAPSIGSPSIPFLPGFNCYRLTNDEARSACLKQQGSPSDPPHAQGVRPRTTDEQWQQPKPTPPREPELASTGTGFYVSQGGYLLSNAHVVEGCARVVARRVARSSFLVTVVAIDRTSDLALLRGAPTEVVASFRRGPAPLGEAITLFGFPLTGTLASSGNLTTGTVSGLAGVSNDPSRYQISAPIQPGNSGGAVLDESGAVIGIVVSKLDAVMAQRVTGDVPQNVNFAIKASIAQNFLEANGIRFAERSSGVSRKAKEIAEEALKFTVLIACFK